jgi:hypothetical protein
MDIQKSLITYIDNLLRTDTALKAAMGGEVRLYPDEAPPDSEFPYLVHILQIGIVGDFSPIARCTYMLDIWSYSPNKEESSSIRAEIMRLLDGLSFSTAETSDCWLWDQTNRPVPNTTQDIRHYTCQFNLKYIKDAQVGAVLKR